MVKQQSKPSYGGFWGTYAAQTVSKRNSMQLLGWILFWVGWALFWVRMVGALF